MAMPELNGTLETFLLKCGRYDKGFKGTVVNRALPSLHGEPPEIPLTVPLNM